MLLLMIQITSFYDVHQRSQLFNQLVSRQLFNISNWLNLAFYPYK